MDQESKRLDELAASERQGVLGELTRMLMTNKKWWLLPILLILVLVGALILLGGTGAAPFIYTLF